jgi:hypothetical protein
MKVYDLSHALTSLRPGAGWHMIRDMTDYSNIVWTDETQTCPTEQELRDEVTRLQAEFDNKEYQRLRAEEYPSFADQFDLLYHGGYEAWKAVIQETKDKYPKP